MADGWLRLTDASPAKLGIARYERDLPLTAGLSIHYVYRLTGGPGPVADGMVAFLWDPASGEFAAGYGGGSLGYARYCKTGLNGAIFGVAIDVFGTFGTGEPTCETSPGRLSPNSLTVRGPGTNTKGYRLINSTALRRGLTGRSEGESVIAVTVKVFADATVSVLTQYESESVQTEEITRVAFLPEGEPLPTAARVGFAASTGGLYAAHDLGNVSIRFGEE